MHESSGLLGRFEIWQDLRRGEAGLVVRVALSLVAALALLAVVMVFLGVVEAARYVTDLSIAIAVGLASVAWFVALIQIWASYPRFRNVLKAIFGMLAIWGVTVPLCIAVDIMMGSGEEFIIAACILAAISGNILIITSTAHRVRRGKPLLTPGGQININCPSCGYSMVGLHEPRCPECGSRYTLDELLWKQHFGRVAHRTAGQGQDEHNPVHTGTVESGSPAFVTPQADASRQLLAQEY